MPALNDMYALSLFIMSFLIGCFYFLFVCTVGFSHICYSLNAFPPQLWCEQFSNSFLSFRYWVIEMHVDGFRFDLASITTRSSRL